MSKFKATRLVLALGLTGFVASPAFAAKPQKSAERLEHEAQIKKVRQAGIKRMAPARMSGTRVQRPPILPMKGDSGLSERTIKRTTVVEKIYDGLVMYYAADPAQKKDETRAMWNFRKRKLERTAILVGDSEAMLRTKVGKSVTLHLKVDKKGFAHVVNVTR